MAREGKRDTRFTHTRVTGRPPGGRSRTHTGRQACTRATDPHDEQRTALPGVCTACSSSPSRADTTASSRRSRPSITVAALPSATTGGLLARVLDTTNPEAPGLNSGPAAEGCSTSSFRVTGSDPDEDLECIAGRQTLGFPATHQILKHIGQPVHSGDALLHQLLTTVTATPRHRPRGARPAGHDRASSDRQGVGIRVVGLAAAATTQSRDSSDQERRHVHDVLVLHGQPLRQAPPDTGGTFNSPGPLLPARANARRLPRRPGHRVTRQRIIPGATRRYAAVIASSA